MPSERPMKMTLALAAIVAVTAFYALQVQSVEPRPQATEAVINVPQLRQELLATLTEAYDQRFQEYNGGRSDPAGVIRLSAKLYDAEIESVEADERIQVAERHVSRVKQIEELAAHFLKSGTTMRGQLLETKAARLSAQLELARWQQKEFEDI